PKTARSAGFGIFCLGALEQPRSTRVRDPGWSVEVVEQVVTLVSNGTRLQVDQALAQGPQAKKGRARKTEACRRRSKERQQPTPEWITGQRRAPGSTITLDATMVCPRSKLYCGRTA